MNKLFFALILGLFLVACQDTPKNANETGSTAPIPTQQEAPAVASPEEMQNATVSISEGIKLMEDIRKQASALPEKVKKEKADEIEGITSSLDGLIEKQSIMLSQIQATLNPAATASTQESAAPEGLTPALIKDYTESVVRYRQEAKEYQEALNKLSSKQ